MKKQSKILLAVLAVAVVAGVAVYAGNSGLFQGKLAKVPKCNISFENFDPNPDTVAKYGEAVDFKWNGPGCSKYDWTQYELCFQNVNNSQEFACIGVIPNSNHWTLSGADWRFINGEMKTLTSPTKVDTNWHVQSIFGNALKGEILTTKRWKFSYTK